jgi:dihydroorotate dehydrogenase
LRSSAHDGFTRPPYYLFVDRIPEDLLQPNRAITVSLQRDEIVYPTEESSSINSFGIPSLDPRAWRKDIRAAVDALSPDQLFIASVIGAGSTCVEVAADFAQTALRAADAGAHALELNLSYLQVPADSRTPSGSLYCEDTDLAERILNEVLDAVDDVGIALVAKLSYMHEEALRQLVPRLAPLTNAISGINAIPVSAVWTDSGTPAFGDEARPAGIAGAAIRKRAREFVESLSSIRNDILEHFEIIASGGVMTAQDALELRARGADSVQSATGAYLNPYLAWDIHSVEDDFGAEPGDHESYLNAIRAVAPFPDPSQVPFIPRRLRYAAMR